MIYRSAILLAAASLAPSPVPGEGPTSLGGEIALIARAGCEHHPHGLNDPTPIVHFVVAHASEGKAAQEAIPLAPKVGSVTVLPRGAW